MCGIIAVLRRRSRRQPPTRDQVQACLDRLSGFRADLGDRGLIDHISQAASSLADANRLLTGSPGATCLIRNSGLIEDVQATFDALSAELTELELAVDAGGTPAGGDQESLNAALIQLKDAAWAVGRDRLDAARTVLHLGSSVGDAAIPDAGGAASEGLSDAAIPGARGAAIEGLSDAAIQAYLSITLALSALDRLEVRGRDSAGLHILVTGHGLDLDDAGIQELLRPGLANRLFTNTAVRTPDGHLGFVYKAAAEIGELGDNGRALREAIRADRLLRRALADDDAEAVVLGHTRWASVGIISQANAHPVNQEEVERADGPYVTAVLNGDVDNHLELQEKEGLQIAAEITTDTKVIPTLVSRRLAQGTELTEAFRQSVASFVGSVAIGCSTAAAPDRLHLALRGSGQGVFIGLAEDTFLVASEPYGVVETTDRYLRLDGETPGNPENPSASQGQIVVLHRDGAGELDGVERIAYDGTALPIGADELQTAEITTRDIDRGDHRHFLRKEITEAPQSFKKTLRGRIVEQGTRLRVELGDDNLPPAIRQNLRNRVYKHLLVIGQGTAAVAGQGVAAAMTDALADAGLAIQPMPATELSGFHLRDDMSDTLIVAISQSGTTTDTNRTVDLVRGRGASVLAIVNRRGSDLTDKSDGVIYTSDGRDVEMSVASTKAFYAQIAAGFLLAFAIRQELWPDDIDAQQEILTALRGLPAEMQKVLAIQDTIGQAARDHAPQRRYWAVVGNGKNKVAAEEIRIKLSELCYKSIACDATEDKKHIDLSAEPLILVCAAGLSGSTADDVAKELAIYHAHKAAPILITSDDPKRFPAALHTIRTPDVHPSVAFILSTMVGHLFGYYAALAIDELAHPLRLIRASIEQLVSESTDVDELLLALEPRVREHIATFHKDLAAGRCDGQLEARTAVRLARHLGYVTGTKPLDSYEIETGEVGTPALVVENLTLALTQAIDELTRPVDAIKHQAKTVTVGISRSDEALVTVPLVKALLDAGAPRGRISYRDLRALGSLDPAVKQVLGSTRYLIHSDANGQLDAATVEVAGTTGIADGFPSRTKDDPRLRGTKHLVAAEKQILVARGRSDGRTVLLVPEVQAGHATGLTLLHVEFQPHISAAAMRGVLSGYRNRYAALQDLVTETEPSFDEERLAGIPVADLLTVPVHILADRY